MTDDDKALVQRLRDMADEYDSGHHESWPTIDALEMAVRRIEALSAEVERRTIDGVHTCHDKCQRVACVLRRENERLREALALQEQSK